MISDPDEISHYYHVLWTKTTSRGDTCLSHLRPLSSGGVGLAGGATHLLHFDSVTSYTRKKVMTKNYNR